MARIKIAQVTALPAANLLQANTIYMVSVAADKMECYMTGNAASTVKRILNESDINTLINNAVQGLSSIEVVADIAARDALNPTTVVQAYVIDASSDTTVDSGGATYIYDLNNTAWVKQSEAESLDVVLQWANIQGRPASSVAAIDAAVAASHTHANKTTLDQLGQDNDGDLTYNGSKVANEYTSTDW